MAGIGYKVAHFSSQGFSVNVVNGMTQKISSLQLAHWIIDELLAQGITTYIVCPGNRSAPLVWALEQKRRGRTIPTYDERSAAFFALGIGKVQKHPAAVITTSGTAVANLFPALLEAAYDSIPLILITADRPWELHAIGANQTIAQDSVFGSAVRYATTISAPDPNISPEAVRNRVAQAVFSAQMPLPGPVHINCQFREPLHPHAEGQMEKAILSEQQTAEQQNPYVHIRASYADPAIQREVEELINTATDPLILLGSCPYSLQSSIRRWLTQSTIPVIADITSGVRLSSEVSTLIPYVDILVRQKDFQQWHPDRIFWIGGRFVSKRLLQWVATRKSAFVRLTSYPDTLNPALVRMEQYVFPLEQIPNIRIKPLAVSPFVQQLLDQRNRIAEVMIQELDSFTEVIEAAVFQQLFPLCGRNFLVFLGNSIAIRDADTFAPLQKAVPIILANRGVSGIDGLISTAAGICFGADSQPVVAVLGDLSVLHDLNGLHFLSALQLPVKVLVLNNAGGGIFSRVIPENMLPRSTQLFELPHSYAFQSAAQTFHLPYVVFNTRSQLLAGLEQFLRKSGPAVAEVKISPTLSKAFWKKWCAI